MNAANNEITAREPVQSESTPEKALENLRVSEIRYRRLFESARDGILILDAVTRKITDVNPFMVEMLGYSRAEFLGKELWELGLLKDEEASAEAFRELQENGYIRYDDLPLETKDGQSVSVEFVSNVYAENGHQVIQCNIRDITARKSAKETSARLAAIVESSDDAIISKTLNGIITTWNAGAQKMYGYTAQEAIGRPVSFLAPADLPDEMSQLLEKIRRGESVEHYETERVRKDGSRLHISLSISPMKDANGHIVGASSIKRDITQRKRGAVALHESQRFLQSTLDALSSHIAVLDETGKIIAVNQAWRQFAEENDGTAIACGGGANYLEICGKASRDWSEEAPLIARGIREVLSGLRHNFGLEYPCHSPHEQRWFNVCVTRFGGQGPTRVVVAHENITERKQAEQALRISMERFEILSRATNDAVWDWNLTTDDVRWNEGLQTLFGYNKTESGVDSWTQRIHPDDFERVNHGIHAAIESGQQAWSDEYRFCRADGSYAAIFDRGFIIHDDDSRPVRMVGSMQDITERKQAEESLRESESRLRALVESIDEIVFEFDSQGTYVNIWTSQESLLAQPKAELLGRRVQDVLGTAIGLPFVEAFQRVIASSRAESIEYALDVTEGKRSFLARLSPILAADGSCATVCMLSRDITERKLAEVVLRHSEERYRSLTLASAQIVWIASPDGMVEDIPAWRDFTGQSLEEVRGWGWTQALHPDDREPTEKIWANSVETRSLCELEYRVRAKDGSYRLFAVRGVPILESDGSIREWVGTCTDIHDRRLAEEERDRFFTLSLDMLSIIGSDGYIKRLNPAFEETLGFSNAELMAVPFLQFVHPEDIPATLAEMAKLESGVQVMRFENRYRCRDGSYKWLQWMIAPFEDLWYCVAHDITERKQAESSLEVRVRIAALGADVGMALTRPGSLQSSLHLCVEAIVQHLNAAFARIWTLDEQAAVLELQASAGLYTHLNGAHSRIPVGQFKIGLIAAERQPHLTNSVIGDPRVGDQEWAMREGMVAFAGYPLIVGDRVVGVMAMFSREELSGVTLKGLAAVADEIALGIEHKRTEQALLAANDELEMRVAERTEELAKTNAAMQIAKEEAEAANLAKSEFLSRMSHELRTPLNAILGFGQILDKQDLTPLSKESVGYILKGGRHLLDLINEVLDIARVEAGHLDLSLEPVALGDAIPDACALVRPLAAERNIRLDENSAELNHNYVLADRQRLKQVLINLLSNAIKYNREGGQVEVYCGQKSDGWISIAVRDTGPGISPEDLPKLFAPFERLSASASAIEGTGLGLVLSQRLVTAMGGTLKVESTLGVGTIFTLELPQTTSPEEQLTNVPQSTPHSATSAEFGRTFSVLCIEDNPSNFRLMEAIFIDRPEITLLGAMQGSIGLDLARQHEPDLILLDLDLPDIRGSEVLNRLQQSAITRDIPVVVFSADATPNQIDRLLATGARAYLTKPLDVSQFLHTVDEFLGEAPENAPQTKGDKEVT